MLPHSVDDNGELTPWGRTVAEQYSRAVLAQNADKKARLRRVYDGELGPVFDDIESSHELADQIARSAR